MTNIGTLVIMKIGTVTMVGESSTSFKSAQTMIETSSKLTGMASTFKGGRINQTMSVSSMASTDPAATTYGIKQALDAQASAVEQVVTITEYTTAAASTALTGAIKLTANCLLSDITWDNPDNGKQTMALSLQITGGTIQTVN